MTRFITIFEHLSVVLFLGIQCLPECGEERLLVLVLSVIGTLVSLSLVPCHLSLCQLACFYPGADHPDPLSQVWGGARDKPCGQCNQHYCFFSPTGEGSPFLQYVSSFWPLLPPLYGMGSLGHFFGPFTTTSMLRTTFMNYFLTGSIFRPLPWAGQTCRGSCRSCLCNTHWGQAGLESQEKWETIKIGWIETLWLAIQLRVQLTWSSLLMKIYELHMERQLQIWPGRPSGPKSIRGPWYKWSVGLLQWSDLLGANQHMLLLTSLHPFFFSPTPPWQDLLGKLPNFLLTGASLSVRYSHMERALAVCGPLWKGNKAGIGEISHRPGMHSWLLRSGVVAWG